MSDDTYKHGSMSTETQEKTFDGFLRMVTRAAVLCIILLLFIALVNG